MTPFQSWITTRFEGNAIQYRAALLWITDTVTGYCSNGERLNEGQAAAMLELLRATPVPVLGKYPGEASPEDKNWYANCLKPDYRSMLMDAEEEIKKLC